MTRVLFGNYLNNLARVKKGSTKVNSFEINMNNETISNDLDIAHVLMII